MQTINKYNQSLKGMQKRVLLFTVSLFMAAILFSNVSFGKASAADILKRLDKKMLAIDSTSDYLCYYGSWDADKVFRAKDFDLIILEPSNITAAQISDIKKGHDGLAGTNDDVVVIGYVSIGETNTNNYVGNGKGPSYWSWDSSKIVYENKGVASFYLDDRDINGAPDMNGTWGSYYINAGDPAWYDYVKVNIDNTLSVKACDGLFLDTIDSGSPYAGWPYRWMVVGMSQLIGKIRSDYPDKYLIANRGLFYFDPDIPTAYNNTVRPYVNAVMYEDYINDGTRAALAKKINTEAKKPDGFKVIALDYFDPSQTAAIDKQVKEVFSQNWADYISVSALNQIRYDVFHKHFVDNNPPSWDNIIGIYSGETTDTTATIFWKSLTDQSLPLKFDVYYSSNSVFDIKSAVKISSAAAVYNSAGKYYQYTVTGLKSKIKYNFLVRTIDAKGNSEKNTKVYSLTTSSTPTVKPIIIDGLFDDWKNVPVIDTLPNPQEYGGDVPAADVNADFVTIWVSDNTENLFISFNVKGVLSAAYFYHVFINSDLNSTKGYRYNDSSSIGIEFMIENGSLWKYTGAGGSNWGWAAADGMKKIDMADRTEISIPLATLNLTPNQKQLRLILQANKAVAPYSLVDIAPDNYKEKSFIYNLSSATGVESGSASVAAKYFELKQNYPNPFNPSTTIEYEIVKAGFVSLKVYDILGNEIETLVNEYKNEGTYKINFPKLIKKDIPSGVYLYKLLQNGNTSANKMVLIR